MKNLSSKVLAALAAATFAGALAACGGGSDLAPPATVTPPPAAATAAPQPGTDRGAVGDGKSLRSSDGRLEIRSAGKSSFDVTINVAATPPPAPQGWSLAAPVYDISARDNDRAVTRLAEPLELRFSAGSGPLSVMYHDGSAWVLVDSDLDGSTLIASTDHLTPYTVAKPTKSDSAARPSATPPASATQAPTAIAPAASRTPGANVTVPAVTPGANVTTAAATVSTAEAQAALESVVQKYKGKKVKVTGAAGYSGSAGVSLPASIESALGKALAGGGQVYYGLYNGVNEAFTTGGAAGAASGSLTVLAEPKPSFPTSSTDASAQLAALFPGSVGPTYQKQASSATSYTFWSQSNGAMWVLGFVQWEGVPLAFMVVGSGSYATAALVTVNAN